MKLIRVIVALAFGLLALVAEPAAADEGMWTFDKLPLARLATNYHFTPPPGWAEHLRSSAVRLATGCSGSFISPKGLVLSNHHCARGCLEGLSTPTHSLIELGFFAATAADERKCPDFEVDQLVDIIHVSDQIKSATAGRTGPEFRQAEQAAIAMIEKGCTTGATVRCDVVTLFHGGVYDLYRYRRYQDVRLVFAPEEDAASFGDATTADWPLHALDMSLVRVYDNGRPLDTHDNHLAFAPTPTKVGDLVFVAGNPGYTERLSTVAQLELARDVDLPMGMEAFAELHGVIGETVRESPEFAHEVNVFLSQLTARRFVLQHRVLANTGVLTAKAQAEAKLRAKVAADPVLAAKYGAAWDAIAQAVAQRRAIDERFIALEWSPEESDLFRYAKLLVRGAAQQAKPDALRLSEYRDSNRPALRADILSPAPVYPAVETRKVAWALSRLLIHLSSSDPATLKLIGHESPHDIAERLVAGTKLGDVKVRQALLDGGAATIAASTDPLIVYVRDKWEPLAIAMREKFEDTEATVRLNAALIDQARLAVLGPEADPDATFSPRVSYGAVRGYRLGEVEMPAETTIGEAFVQDTGRTPFRLPKSWLAAKRLLDMKTPLNFASTADLVGGNSGSPVVNREGKLVGLAFAINDAGEGGTYGHDDSDMRAIAVSVSAIRTALKTIYHADRILREIDGK